MMDARLLATKFYLPPWNASCVTRPHLLEQLTRGLHEKRKLTLVSAPPGYGKTTLITGWLHSLPQSNLRVAWLALDENDNDPARFLSYLAAAFQQAAGVGIENIQPFLSHAQPLHGNRVVDELLNKLSGQDNTILLALDDYHTIIDPQIHEILQYFLEHQPAQIHLILTTRKDPPLPLPRLRASGHLTEIRARDLRFTPEEAHQFFLRSMKLDLVEGAARALEERTEGWVVGLQLAGLALQKVADPQRFIETFRGSHRYVLDYLAEEIIRQQADDMRAFLTHTSVLDRFNAGACSALTGRDDAQEIIMHLEQANLFIVSLDDERVWFRYHQLFADYLRTLLSPLEKSELTKKASAWHEANNLVVEAVHYALASGDPDFSADVIERAVTRDTTWSEGNITLLASWLDSLPAQAPLRRPQLSLNASYLLYLSGRFEQAERCIAQAEQSIQALPVGPEADQMLALVALYRGSIAAVRGQIPQAIEQLSFAQSRLPRENRLAHARAFFSLGLAFELSDQNDLAAQHYLQSSDEARNAGVLYLAIHARCAAAQVHIKQGRLTLAEQSCQAAIQFADGARIPPLGLARILLGGIALERNNLTTGEQLLLDGIALAREGGLMDDVILGLSYVARLHAARGDADGAYAVHQEASSLINVFEIPHLSFLASAYMARIQLQMGHAQAAAQWAEIYREIRGTTPFEYGELTLARILLAAGELNGIPSILDPLLKTANKAGRTYACIEVTMLLGLYHAARKDIPSALDWLDKSLRLAAPEGYTRIFLDEGKPLLDLLPRARPSAPDLVDTLLGMRQPASGPGSAALDRLPEPLSDQEQRVLRLVVAGKSNREIAAELVISVGTAKWHVHHVLQKLGVSNRPQAIALAHEFGFK